MKRQMSDILCSLNFRRILLLTCDVLIIVASYMFAIYNLGSVSFYEAQVTYFKEAFFVILILQLIIFKYFSFYSSLWEYAGMEEVSGLFLGVTASVALSRVYCIVAGCGLDKSVFLVVWVLQFVSIGAIRSFYRSARQIKNQSKYYGKLKRVMIVGAGAAGALLIREVRANSHLMYSPVVFIDDDRKKHKCRIQGIYVAGGRDDIAETALKYQIDEIILALPSAPKKDIMQIAHICSETGLKVKTMPSMHEIILEGVSLKKIREIDVHDFLGREEVDMNIQEVERLIKGKVVIVTGGGGSIGSEICRQIAPFSPAKLIIFDIYENNAHDLQNELISKYGESICLKVLIGSVRDRERLDYVFKNYSPDVVFHAAAHKHVPLMEDSPVEAVKNNVFGTLNVAEISNKYNVKNFVLISTDKAVNPTNVMGATKRVAEMIMEYMNQISKTKFAAVRFGNVLGSNGSVVPLFRRQIAQGGPVTVTHPEITRYFMTIPEAAGLVLQAGAMAKGGEIFVLDMGEPIKITNLAKKLIFLSGLKPGTDIEIVYTGLRPGEKLYEELWLEDENLKATGHSKISTAYMQYIDPEWFYSQLKEMEKKLYSENKSIINTIEKLIGKSLKIAV